MTTKTAIRAAVLAVTTFLTVTLPVFASTGTTTSTGATTPAAPPSIAVPSGDSAAAIAAQAQAVIKELDATVHLATIQGIVVVVIAFFVIKGAVAASRNQNTQKLWQEIAFGIAGIVLVIDPIIIIDIAIWAGSFFG